MSLEHFNAPMWAMHNRASIEDSALAGCYHCVHVFSVQEIEDWTDNGQTALCPICQVDSVIPQSVGIGMCEETLQKLHDRWFSPKPNDPNSSQT